MMTIQESPCKEVYMTRTGSKQGMPNKCAAIVSVPAGSNSPYFQNIRRGISANMPDKYVYTLEYVCTNTTITYNAL